MQIANSTRPIRRLMLLVTLVGTVLAACTGSEDPVLVYVTPTHQGAATGLASPTPTTATATHTPTPTTTNPPPTLTPSATQTPTPSATATVPPATAVPTATPTPRLTLPPDIEFGALVGPDYSLPPTATRSVPTLPPTDIPTPGPSPTLGPGLRRSLLGVQVHPNISSHEFRQVLDHAHTLGVTWIKFQFNWSLMEHAPGQYTELFFILRQHVQQTHDEGFRVLVSIAKAPGWSRTPDADGVLREDGPPDDPAALARFITTVLEQTGRDANGAPRIDAMEIWNEPNLEREWRGRPLTGGDYMRYFGPAYQAVRQFSNTIVVITAGPAPTDNLGFSTNDRTWLQQLYGAGLARYGNDVAVGVHPYGWANAPDARCCANPSRGWDEAPQFYFLDTIEDYRQIMTSNGHGTAQLWVTEFGWATFDGLRTGYGTGSQPPDPEGQAFFSFIDQQDQARFTLRAFELGQERGYIGPMFLWNLNFAMVQSAVDNRDPKTGYSLLNSAGQPRPVYHALQQAQKS